jgi:hypothetical protein
MTKTFAVNDKNDLYLNVAGNIAIVVDLEATLQACAQATKTVLGEMVLATDQGVPYFQNVWSGIVNQQQFDAALRTAILGVEGVVEVVSLVITQEQDTVVYTAVIRTIYGQGEISG